MQSNQNILSANSITTSWRQRKLYSRFHVCLATFIGSPLAGGFLLYHNFKTTGQRKKANNALALSVLATLVLTTLALTVPDGVPSSIFLIPQIFGMSYAYESSFGDAFEKFVEQGFTKANGWEAAGIGLLFMALLASILLAVLVASGT